MGDDGSRTVKVWKGRLEELWRVSGGGTREGKGYIAEFVRGERGSSRGVHESIATS